MVKYLRIVGFIVQWTLDKKKMFRHYNCTGYGDKEYNYLEAEMPCSEEKPQEEVGCPLDLAGSCRTWLMKTIIYVVLGCPT